ncbi:MAG TPA: phage holin family protein [Candidatus Binatia bacterium]|nr:phage holin family protein [Candidatus Binatia bacterium]
MVDQRGNSGAEGSPGFSKSFKAFLAALSSGFHTRLELFATELEEERERLRQTLLLILLVFFGLSFGLILLTIFIVVLFWERGWITAIGCLAALYMGVGVIAALKLRNTLLTRPGLFPHTLAELGKDRDRLRASARE